jgi:hypothetical protein
MLALKLNVVTWGWGVGLARKEMRWREWMVSFECERNNWREGEVNSCN